MKHHVISHTHWDREWYEPFEQFRIRLVSLIDNLLDLMEKKDGFIFHLDAQTSVLEDYLEIKPHNKSKLKKYISEGRILIGPWYVQNDFYLTSGEATVRNLLIGTKMAEEFGKCDKAGYAPDQFGLISQLPQILNQFEIDNCIFGRGVCYNPELNEYEGVPGIEHSEFYWKGEDGSEVLGVHMPFWYNNAQRFSKNIKKSLKYLESIKENSVKLATSKHLLLMNGVDHLEAQENLIPILKKMNKKLPSNEQITQSTFCKYVKALKKHKCVSEEITGELRYGHELSILHGTLSSRSYLKTQNVKSQNALEKQLEPILMFTNLAEFDTKEYEEDYLHYLWKLLIQNHPHDSICGCSRDSVHQHMVDRYARLEENIKYILPRKLALITQHIEDKAINKDSYVVTVFNTQPYKQTALTEVTIELPSEEEISSFNLLDTDGKPVKFEILTKVQNEKALRSPINLPGKIDVDCYKVQILAENIPALGYRTYVVIPNAKVETQNLSAVTLAKENPAPNENKRCSLNTQQINEQKKLNLENKFLKVEIKENGTINLFDKSLNKKFNGIVYFDETEDCGDSYIYKSSDKGFTVLSKDFIPKIRPILNNSLRSEYKLTFTCKYPSYFDHKTMLRSKRTRINKIEMTIGLSKNSKKLDIDFSIDNTSMDHRIRAIINTNIISDYTTASIPFDVVERSKKDYWNLKFKHDKSRAMTDFVETHDNAHGIAVYTEGLHSYEHLNNGKIAVTLLRGNGYIETWNGIPKDSTWIAPENQCIGTYRFRLEIQTFDTKVELNDLSNNAQEFLTPILSHFNCIDPKKFTGGRPCVQDSEVSEIFFRPDPYKKLHLPSEKSFLKIDNKSIVLTAFKKSEKNNNLIIRCFNSTTKKQKAKFKLGFTSKKIYKTLLSEKRTESIKFENDKFSVFFKPKEIVTIEVKTGD